MVMDPELTRYEYGWDTGFQACECMYFNIANYDPGRLRDRLGFIVLVVVEELLCACWGACIRAR